VFQTALSTTAPPIAAPGADDGPLPPEAYRAIAALTALTAGGGGAGAGRVVAHQPCFARVFGGAACGLLLSQFWFWTGTPCVRERNGGWFWKSQREITDETGLSRAETETARRRLCAAGVLEEERRGLPATMHFRLDVNVVVRAVWRHLQAQDAANKCAEAARTALRETRTLVRGNVASKFARIAHSISEKTSETISEKTQKITQTRARPVSPSALGEGKDGEGKDAAPLGAAQCAVNRSGAARLKAALGAATRAAPARRPPFSLTPGRRGDILGRQAPPPDRGHDRDHAAGEARPP